MKKRPMREVKNSDSRLSLFKPFRSKLQESTHAFQADRMNVTFLRR